MKLKQISPWTNIESIESKVDSSVLSWLKESGPITKRIKLSNKFQLRLLNDALDEISKRSNYFLGHLLKLLRLEE
jgi:hypothetical protein